MAHTVFISYSHSDESLKDEFLVHLAPLRREGIVGVWHDRMLRVGEHLDHAIETQLAASTVVILLVSASFLNSDYCVENEMVRAFERAAKGKAVVAAVILRPCQWMKVPIGSTGKLGDFVALPKDGRPVASFEDHDVAWDQIVASLRSLILAATSIEVDSLGRGEQGRDIEPRGGSSGNRKPTSSKILAKTARNNRSASDEIVVDEPADAVLEPFSQLIVGAVVRAANAFVADGPVGLATGLTDLDRLTGGLRSSEFTLLGGEPRQCANAFALDIAFKVARRYSWEPEVDQSRRTVTGGIVAFFSLEIASEKIATSLLAHASGVATEDISSGEISAADFGKLRDSAEETQGIPLFVCGGPISTNTIAQSARDIKRRHGLDLIVVDGLDKIVTRSKSPTGARAEAASALKSLARELSVPILATVSSKSTITVPETPNIESILQPHAPAPSRASPRAGGSAHSSPRPSRHTP